MAFVYVPDSPMMGSGCYSQPESETVKIAKAIIKQHKADKKNAAEKEKKEEASKKPRTFTFLETWGILMLGSIPLTLLQVQLLHKAEQILNAAFNVPH